ITDSWSMSVLFKEIGQLYAACVAGLPSPLPDLPIQYEDFARWQREAWTDEVLDRQLTYWCQQLAGADAVLELPADRGRRGVRTARGAVQRLVLSSAWCERLKAVGRKANATLFMTLLAAFQTLLWRYTGREDLVVGAPAAGRSEVELESLIGFFVNNLVLRTNLSGN